MNDAVLWGNSMKNSQLKIMEINVWDLPFRTDSFYAFGLLKTIGNRWGE